ncbi:MAG: hypothetical protein WCS88_03675 [Patescibacteria group bacterium]|jgi:hypothetical protein
MKKLLLTFSLIILVLPILSQASPAEIRLRGKILLQVEANGEAWYVKPEDGQRMYMKDGDAAYGMMRDLGLGVSNSDINKIPIGFEDRFECLDSDNDGLCDKLEDGLGTDKYNSDTDNDGYDDGTEVKANYNPLGAGNLSYDLNLANRLKGKILLQVETNGEAWYINPDNNKRYYMPDGPSAYQIMRFLSLGITNGDLARIDVEAEEEISSEEIADLDITEQSNCYVDFANNLEQCNVGFSCNFMHPLTGEQLEMRVVAMENGVCKTEEDLPNNGLLSCSLADDDLKTAVVKMYRDMSSGNYEAEVDIDLTTGEGTNVYIVDGETIENPLDEATNRGICVVGGY